ncbi:MAG: metal-binding heat shock protein [Candidatus Midichloriaceae bacterium]|jgi:probable rRNA maturation factor|nr:metal-binding heat shock protein [Candidatus Midichloriaceae bacterium]
MSNIKINYVISVKNWKEERFNIKELTLKAASAALKLTKVFSCVDEVEFTINLSDDAELQNLNKEFMNNDYPTNVLSFPANEVNALKHNGYSFLESYIGDIAISFSRIQEEAIEQGKEFKNHYAHMVVHAILHLVGYDHQIESEANVMESLEIQALKTLGIDNPYEI